MESLHGYDDENGTCSRRRVTGSSGDGVISLNEEMDSSSNSHSQTNESTKGEVVVSRGNMVLILKPEEKSQKGKNQF